MRKFLIASAIALTSLSIAAPAFAGDFKPISQEAYQQAAASGKPYVMFVKADWCPVCKREMPILESLMKDPAFKDYTILVVDFDANKKAVAMLQVEHQSTLVVMRGNKDIARATGLTDEAAIRALLLKAA